MNQNICKACRRYATRKEELSDVPRWLCAKNLYEMSSEVIPGYVYCDGDEYHPVKETQERPPEWCEFILEQTLSLPGDTVNINHLKQARAFPRRN
jgi:hypothetical protein